VATALEGRRACIVELSSPQAAVRYVELRWQQHSSGGHEIPGRTNWEPAMRIVSLTGMTPDSRSVGIFSCSTGPQIFGLRGEDGRAGVLLVARRSARGHAVDGRGARAAWA